MKFEIEDNDFPYNRLIRGDFIAWSPNREPLDLQDLYGPLVFLGLEGDTPQNFHAVSLNTKESWGDRRFGEIGLYCVDKPMWRCVKLRKVKE